MSIKEHTSFFSLLIIRRFIKGLITPIFETRYYYSLRDKVSFPIEFTKYFNFIISAYKGRISGHFKMHCYLINKKILAKD